MTHEEIVFKLIGNIHPVGETRTDEKRFDNLKDMCALVEDLICHIKGVAKEDGREHSIKKASDYAKAFLNSDLIAV